MLKITKLWRDAALSRVQVAWAQGFFVGVLLTSCARTLAGTP